MELRTIPIRRIGNRYHLFLGGDREGVMVLGLLCVTLIFVGQSWRAAGVGLVMWFALLGWLRKAGAADPLMRHVYLRNRRYRPYYPPRATPYRVNSKAQANRYKLPTEVKQ